MSKNHIISIISSLKKDLANIPELLSEMKHEMKMMTACMPCDFLPFEILRACGIHPFIMPPGFDHHPEFHTILDAIITPKSCCFALSNRNNIIPAIIIDAIPATYGDNSLHEWKTLLGNILSTLKGKDFEIPVAELRSSAGKYATLRRLVRGITLLRREKPDALSNADLEVIFSSALAFPPGMIAPKLSSLLDALNDYSSRFEGTPIPALIYGRCRNRGVSPDDLEKEGFLIVEDDICGGRRSFDLSYNTGADYLYDEIINAFSFRPFCPCLRSATSRFELLYMLAGSYGIETVIFIDDNSCPTRASHIDFMRRRLMRFGIDHLVLHPENPIDEARRYVDLASR